MNPFIRSLMGQQITGSGIVATPEQEAESERLRRQFPNAPEFGNETEILVSRDRAAPVEPVDRYVDYNVNNEDAVMGRQADVRKTEEASTRRGMFGMRGTLRDVLGVLGDAFLVQSGKNPMYAPTRQREKISDAMAGYTVDPVGAAERVSFYDPALGREMLQDYQTGLLREAQQRSLAEGRASQIEARDIAAFDKARESIARLLANPNAYGPDGKLTPVAESIAGRLAAAANRSLEDFDVVSGMDRTAGSLLSSTGATVNQQNMMPLQERRTTVAERNAASSETRARAAMKNADKPRAGRAPRAETDREAAIRIGNKPENQRTPGERAFYEKYTRPPGNRGTRTLNSDPLGTRAAPSSRFGPPRN